MDPRLDCVMALSNFCAIDVNPLNSVRYSLLTHVILVRAIVINADSRDLTWRRHQKRNHSEVDGGFCVQSSQNLTHAPT
jgi:hypothetical protein